MSQAAQAAFDESRFNQFLGQMAGEMGAAANAELILIGDRIGLYKALARSLRPNWPEKPERTSDMCMSG